MDVGIAAILAAVITTIGGIIVTIIKKTEKSVKDAEKSVVKAEKSIKAVSGNLPSWELLFEHDTNGTQISGAIDRLIEAVEEGYQIKVKIFQTNGTTQVMDAQWLFVDNKAVYASNINHISLTRNDFGKYVYQENSYHYYVLVGSNGHHHATRVNLDGSKRNPTDSTRHMAWIGLVPPMISSK